ncbi:discoidin domain-containing protein [Clostridium perfringens]|nr:discoidin domain-containing protein [Clostridium perfringens]
MNFKSSSKNLALNKPSTASSNEPSREANKGNDGDESSRWCASSENSNQWWQVDLGDIYDIEGISVKWEKRSRLWVFNISIRRWPIMERSL